jgi:hypothetical protein
MLFELGIGYDFGRVVPKFSFDIGVPITGKIASTSVTKNTKEYFDAKILKFGIEVGFKPLKSEKVEMILPLGMEFCISEYTAKIPGYTSNGHQYDKIYDYSYYDIFSGVDLLFKLNKNFKIGAFSKIGFPIKHEVEYKSVLRGNYIWASTGSKTYSEKYNVDVLQFSVGIGVVGNL